LLAIPGAALFALHLFDKDTAVNTWLQQRFNLSYHVALPWLAALILLLLPLLILLLYFLKLKRKPVQVPSTFLWRKSIEDLHVNSLFQWLRQNVLLLLQILTLLLLIYAVMAFQVHGNTSEGRRYIVMIDNSASMSASDVAPSRLEQAKQQALQTIDSYSDRDVGMVVVFNADAQTLRSFTSDRGLLRRAVELIEPTHRPTRLDEALNLAASLANPQSTTEETADQPSQGQRTEVHLFSDGRFPDVPGFAVGNLNVQFHAIGQPGADAVDNVGLVTLNAQRPEGSTDRLLVFARVHNYRQQPVALKVQLDVRRDGTQGELIGSYDKRLELPGRKVEKEKSPNNPEAERDTPGEGTATFELSGVDDRTNVVLHARLTDAAGRGRKWEDKLALDDEAWLVAGIVRKARVLVVGPRNKALHDFFDQKAMERLATVKYLTPSDLQDDQGNPDEKEYEAEYRQPARDGAYDLVIFDRWAPEREADLPLANAFFIDAVPPPWKRAAMPRLVNPSIQGWMGKHPLLRHLVRLHSIRLSEAFEFRPDPAKDPPLPPRMPRLLEARDGVPLLCTLNRQSFTDLVMTFPLINAEGRYATDWPRDVLGFSLFLCNVLYVLGNVSDGANEERLQPGQIMRLVPDAPGKELEIEVIDPAGRSQKLKRGVRADVAFGATDSVGVYQAKWNGTVQRLFAVNLLDADESNIEPRSQFRLGESRIGAGESRSLPRETWKWIAAAALVLLLVEWFLYNRRVYI
jgi:hypothetical protein